MEEQEDKRIMGEKLKSAVREASALILSKRYRTRGAPQQRIEQIFRERDIPSELGLRITREELDDIGVKLKEIKEKWGAGTITRYIGVIDPSLGIEDIRPYNRRDTAILALIAAKGRRVPFSEVNKEVQKIVNDEEEANNLLSSAVSRLKEDDVIKLDKEKGTIELTDFGQAILPPEDQIKKIIIDTLISGKGNLKDF